MGLGTYGRSVKRPVPSVGGLWWGCRARVEMLEMAIVVLSICEEVVMEVGVGTMALVAKAILEMVDAIEVVNEDALVHDGWL
jgi:hypothetical protein